MKYFVLSAAIATAVVAGLTVFAAPAARQPLFAPGQARAALGSDASYLALSGHRATASLQLVQADAAQIAADSDILQFSTGSRALFARRTKFVRNPDGTSVWFGNLSKDTGLISRFAARFSNEIEEDPLNSVIIVRNGHMLTGSMRIDGELYQLRPLKSGGHAIVRVDESKMPDHSNDIVPALRDSVYPRVAAQPQAEASTRAVTPTVIRVMVVSTQAVVNAVADLRGLVNLAISETNQGYLNSGVNITVQLAGNYSTSYVESGSAQTDLNRFIGTSDRYMDTFHGLRDSNKADVAVLLFNTVETCGKANLRVDAATAFAAVSHTCATGNYSFGHEIGHLLGADHDKTSTYSNPFYAYGHGFEYKPTTGSRWRTIMAVSCGACTRLNYWSNPNKTYNNVVMGTTSTSNNARVLNERAATVAGFRN